MNDEIPPILLGLLAGLILATCSNVEQVSSKMERTEDNYITVRDSAIIAQAPHFVDKFTTLAVVDCIMWEETKDDPNAINWDDWHERLDGTWVQGSFGCLQFSLDTFNEYCVGKYGMKNDIMDCGIARECAMKMLEENKGHRWSTYSVCNN